MIEVVALAVAQLIGERPTRCETVDDCPTKAELRQAILDHDQHVLAEVQARWTREGRGVVVGPDAFRLAGPTQVKCVGRAGASTCSYAVVWGHRYRERAIANLSRPNGSWLVESVNSLVEALH